MVGSTGTWPADPATAHHRTVPQGKSRHATRASGGRPNVTSPERRDMTQRQLSATDAALRERIRELSVHIPCGGLRGPVLDRNTVRWQSCRDEDAPERWADCEVSRLSELCVICFRATAGGPTRWAWIACSDCRAVNDAKASTLGVRPFALGRHSLMNGIGVGRRGSVVRRERELAGLVPSALGDPRITEWRRREYRRLAERFDSATDVPLRLWQHEFAPSREASRDAFVRLLGHASRN